LFNIFAAAGGGFVSQFIEQRKFLMLFKKWQNLIMKRGPVVKKTQLQVDIDRQGGI